MGTIQFAWCQDTPYSLYPRWDANICINGVESVLVVKDGRPSSCLRRVELPCMPSVLPKGWSLTTPAVRQNVVVGGSQQLAEEKPGPLPRFRGDQNIKTEGVQSFLDISLLVLS